MFTLIKNAKVYSPKAMGYQNILICNEKIVSVFPADTTIELPSPLPCKTIDVCGLTTIPGIIDQHVHIIGGGGEDGFQSSIEPLPAEECLLNGVTTVVGLLGTDSSTKTVRQLLAYTKKLNQSGITAYCLTGAYAYPSPTITGSVTDDIIFIKEILGVKLAIADHRSFFPTREELLRLAAQARNGALISGKPGIVHLHMGNENSGLKLLFDILEQTSFPVWHFRPTHVEKNIKDAIRFAELGGRIDFTASDNMAETAEKINSVIKKVPLEKLTVSSDANGSIPVWKKNGELEVVKKSSIASMLEILAVLVNNFKIPLETALMFMTSNPAEGLGLGKEKGQIKEGFDADIVVLSPNWKVQEVFAGGKLVVHAGKQTCKRYYS